MTRIERFYDGVDATGKSGGWRQCRYCKAYTDAASGSIPIVHMMPCPVGELETALELLAAQASSEQRDRIVRWLRECQALLAEPTEVSELEALIASLVQKDAEP